MSSKPIIVWIRRELQLADHPALATALRAGRPVIPVFVLHDTTGRPLGGASRWWLHQSLVNFGAAVHERGGQLILRRGETTPWLSPDGAGIDPAYPQPMVDHGKARKRALRAYKEMRTRAA